MTAPDQVNQMKIDYGEVDVHEELQNSSTTELDAASIATQADTTQNPLNWPLWLKITVLVQTSVLAALGGLNTATINPALNQIAKDFDVDVVRASYQTTVCIALNGIAPFIWIPLAHRYGRRPVWLATTLLGFISILSCAYTKNFQQLLIARVFNGLFPVGFALGVTTVVDLFPYHQRGRAMGFFTVTVANGSHIAPIIGGLLGQYCGWRWIFKFLAICDGIALVVALFCLPETIHTTLRTIDISSPTNTDTIPRSSLPNLHKSPLHTTTELSHNSKPVTPHYRSIMSLFTLNPSAPLSPTSFLLPTLKLFFNPDAVFPATYYAAMYGFASILPAVTAAAIFTKFFHWNTLTIGLTYGGVLTVGGILGEICAGSVCDWIVCRAMTKEMKRWEERRLDGGVTTTAGTIKTTPHRHTAIDIDTLPSLRLLPIYPGVVITTTGLLLYGFTLQYKLHPAVPLTGMGLSSFGLQIITTTTYTYAVDCLRLYHPSLSSDSSSPRGKGTRTNITAELAQLFNLIRQCFGMTFAFYVVRLGNNIGYQWTFLLFAGLGMLAFLPVWGLIKGWIGRGGKGTVSS